MNSCRDTLLIKFFASLRNHGQIARYKHKYIGINGRLDAVQAAVLNVKLAHFKEEIAARIKIGSDYTAKIKAAYKGDSKTALHKASTI